MQNIRNMDLRINGNSLTNLRKYLKEKAVRLMKEYFKMITKLKFNDFVFRIYRYYIYTE